MQTSIAKKCFIKYNKTNGITTMKTHFDNFHSCLHVKKKSILSEKAMAKLSRIKHCQQWGKKKVGPTSFVITIFLGHQTYTKMGHNCFHC
jgi:hypothetical protein